LRDGGEERGRRGEERRQALCLASVEMGQTICSNKLQPRAEALPCPRRLGSDSPSRPVSSNGTENRRKGSLRLAHRTAPRPCQIGSPRKRLLQTRRKPRFRKPVASARKGSPYLAPRRSWGLRRFSVPMLLRPQPDGWVFYLRLRARADDRGREPADLRRPWRATTDRAHSASGPRRRKTVRVGSGMNPKESCLPPCPGLIFGHNFFQT